MSKLCQEGECGRLYDGYGMKLRHVVSSIVTRLQIEGVEKYFLSRVQ